MQKESITAIPVVDDKKKLLGLASMKDLAHFLVDGNKKEIDTTLDNILKVINGEVITKFDDYIKGKMMLVGYQTSTFHDEIILSNDDILIIGDRYKIIDYAIDSKIKTKLTSFEIANMMSLSNYVTNINNCTKPITIYDDDYYDEFQLLTKKTKHNNYPVINHKGECLGLICLNSINEYEKQKVILVDHNNFEQSVEGIEEANILEIIDHHNLGAIGTKVPINFRSMIVGCTATIIYKMFLESHIKIPKNIAGLLLSAIISDTLLFTSPSTTNIDIEIANSLSQIANLDIKEYGYKMLKASSSISGLSINEQIYQDYKSYTVGKLHIGIGQLITMDFEDIKKNIDEYVKRLDDMSSNNPGVHAIFITDIIKKGSYVIYNSKSEELIKDAFNLSDIKEGIFIPNILSRKKQIIPPIMEIMETM